MWKEVDAPGSSGERGGGAAAAGEEKEEKEEQEEEERGWNLEMVLAGAWWLGGKKSRIQSGGSAIVAKVGEGGVNLFQQQNR
jgi:hypothetical protein